MVELVVLSPGSTDSQVNERFQLVFNLRFVWPPMVLQTCVDLRVRLASPEESFLQTKPKGVANQMKDLDECIILVRLVLTLRRFQLLMKIQQQGFMLIKVQLMARI